ncbi:DPH3 [Candida theae]|uniref:Diphthamide biosynthesis protein 3 n=1 Tax=Candida theae TaxID=1198502 RepID=A0AAD5BGB8_9ASCO|nr:DPH3 [Candida theae]KAI5960521.1 DPH3 [Candida theae]
MKDQQRVEVSVQHLIVKGQNMETIYDEIEIEDFTFDPVTQLFQYPCPCGDRFAISIDDLQDGEDIAVCPSCSLMVKVIFEPEDLKEYLNELS